MRLVNNGEEMLYWSERDGWGHYYLYDANGTLKNQVTSGEFVTEDIQNLDEKTRVMTFTAEGRETGENPYFTHLYSIRLDGAGLKLLDPGNASHAGSIADDGKYFVDNASTVNAAPRSVLYDRVGAMTLDLQTTDISALSDAGFKMPEPFQVKADDGLTDLYGVMYKPFDFDPTKKYPIIAFVYPGTADRERDEDVHAEEPERRAGAARLHRDRSRQSRRQSAALEVVSHLRLRQPARLRAGGQESRGRTTGAVIPSSTSTASGSAAIPAAASCRRRRCSSIPISSRSP